jgi:peptidoglycan/xylan/chitin deacetylase (PgdA/CDA1 family)
VANRRLYGWQRSLLIGLVATIVTVVASCGLRISHSPDQGIVISAKLPGHNSQPDSDSSQVKASILDPKETYSKVVSQWAKLDNLKIQNLPLPVQFQGKTSREVKLKVQEQEAPIKAIALTFDDGPWPYTTPKILATLKQQKIKATFFVIGKHVKLYPQTLKQVVAEGHVIGNHTWSHEYGSYSQAAAARELDDTAKLVYKITGVKTVLFRPPAGILNNGLVATAQEEKYAVILWSVDSRDWRYRGGTSSPSLVESVVKEAKPGGIILMHDGGGDRTTTVQALPQIITQLKKQGYTFVTVPELMELGKG